MRSETVSFLLDLNRQFYQQFGAAFSATRQRIQPGVARLLDRLPLEGSWLDLGCGNGALARELRQRGFRGEYVGLDFSEELLREAQKEFQEDRAPHPPTPSPRGGEGEEGLHTRASSPWNSEGEEGPHPPAPSPRGGEGEEGLHSQASSPWSSDGEEGLQSQASSPWNREGEEGLHTRASSPWNSEGEEELADLGAFVPKVKTYTRKVSPVLWDKLRTVARKLRQEPTEAEELLWERLRNRKTLDLKFRRQHGIDRFIVDFYCAEIGLVIEVDGHIHQYTREEDTLRQEFLESQGLQVIRFQNDQVLTDTGQVLREINRVANNLRTRNLTNISNTPPTLHPVERGPGGEVFLPQFRLADFSNPAWSSPYSPASFDVILAFATLHHLPGSELRRQVLAQVRRLLAPGGLFIHSEWQFQNSARLVARRQSWQRIGLAESELEEGDALLDWRYALPGQPEAVGLRYVHCFSLAELAGLAESCGFRVLETFESDGRGGRLGLYQLWQAVKT